MYDSTEEPFKDKRKMKKLIEWIISLFKSNPKPIGPSIDLTGYDLKFQENFNQPIDWDKWDWREKGWISNEYKENTVWYIDMVYKGDLRAEKLPTTKNMCGQITSHKFLNFKYGYISVIAKLPPRGYTYFPAIWLCGSNITEVGWPACNEIDIMECIYDDKSRYNYKDSKTISFTHHWQEIESGFLTHHSCEGKNVTFKKDFSEDYHEFGVLWEPNKLTWYVDGKPYYSTYFNVPDNEMYLICNIGAGGEPAYSRLFESNEVPMSFNIKEIKLYQK